MADKFPSTLLVSLADKLAKLGDDPSRRDVETEIRKADLDLLDKINQISQQIAFTPTVSRSVITTTQTQAAAAAGTWYNKGGSLKLGVGTFDISWSADFSCSASNTIVRGTLSTSSTSETDTDFSAEWIMGTASQTCTLPVYRMKRRIVLTSSTTYYLNVLTPSVATPTIGFAAGAGTGNIIIEAEQVA